MEVPLSYQQVLERLGKLYGFQEPHYYWFRRREFLERSEALRLMKLLRDLVMGLSGGEAKLHCTS